MLTEVGALFVSLAVFRWWLTREKHPNIPHFVPGVELKKDGPFYIVKSFFEGHRRNLPMYSYPLLDTFLGFLKINLHVINDPMKAKEIFSKSEAVGGHIEMYGWWHLLMEYRQKVKGRKWETMSRDHIGIIREHSRADPKGTKIGKLCRRRLMELAAKKQFEPKWIAKVDSQIPWLVEQLKKAGENGTKPIDTFSLTMPAALTVVLDFALDIDLSKHSDYRDRICKYANIALETVVKLDKYKLIFMNIPSCLRKMIPLKYWPDWVAYLQGLYDDILDLQDKHNENWSVGDEATSLLAILQTDHAQGKMEEWDVVNLIQQLCMTGADTTASVTSGIMINLARFPEVQEKLYRILEAQDFRADEFKDCPYLQAVIYEIYRYCPMIYRSLVHSITEKTEILGETFEKEELICFSITGANMNEKYFKDPWKFQPERHLNENGDFQKSQYQQPFNTGKRSCPGQILADIELFHFMKHLVKHFEFKLHKNHPMPVLETEEGWLNFWTRKPHDAPMHHFLQPKERKFLLVPRDN